MIGTPSSLILRVSIAIKVTVVVGGFLSSHEKETTSVLSIRVLCVGFIITVQAYKFTNII